MKGHHEGTNYQTQRSVRENDDMSEISSRFLGIFNRSNVGESSVHSQRDHEEFLLGQTLKSRDPTKAKINAGEVGDLVDKIVDIVKQDMQSYMILKEFAEFEKRGEFGYKGETEEEDEERAINQ